MIDFLIIGAGPAGVASAIAFKRKNPHKDVLILEKEEEILKKVNATGNGKGNFTNHGLSYNKYNNPDFVNAIFEEDPLNKLLKFFDSLGLEYYFKENEAYFPFSNNAKTISYVLKRELDKLNIKYQTNEKVYAISHEADKFYVFTNNKKYEAKNLLIATGGKNYSSLGSDGSMFKEIEKLGIKLTKMFPSNIYIIVENTDITKRLSGLRFNASLSLYNDNTLIYSEEGELLFKDNALSGIVSFNVSNELANLYKKGIVKNSYILVDFANENVKNSIKQKININTKLSDFKEILLGIFNEKLVNVIFDLSYDINTVLKNISAMKFSVKELGDFDHAQETSGGISTTELNYLQSKSIKNLYFAGDVLDIDAKCGGFNLSFAFLSGIHVGEKVWMR